jgi:16S rRNA G966 N2-methylase RsmD
MDNNNNPNIIIYDVLKKYIISNNNIQNNLFNNIYLANINSEYNIIYEFKDNQEYIDSTTEKKKEFNDAWDLSINDEKFYINNKIARIFPIMSNFNNYSKIKIDDDSFSFITIREVADIISKIICFHLIQYNLNPQKIKLSDYTSGVGGNILSFLKYFGFVYAVEKCSMRAEYLENNINVYGFKNCYIMNKCALDFNTDDLIKINPSVIFIDPPWGGSNYKSNDNLLLKLGSLSIEELVIDITNRFSEYYSEIIKYNVKEKNNNYNNKFIILKLPKNYDIEYFYNYLKKYNNNQNYSILSYIYILNKMLIFVNELKFIV